MTAAIQCHEVHRHFGQLHAVKGVSLHVEKQEIFGLLGPNGSGKTTLLNQLQGLDEPTSGSISVLGLDPLRDHGKLVSRIGTQLQEAAIIPRLTVIESLELFASFYSDTLEPSKVLGMLGLEQKARARVESLSGGQRQRLFIALALLHNPDLLFFDELTSAVDPQSRRDIWEILRRLRSDGHTIMLTTHSMEEAQALCDRVAIIDAGSIIAEGTPAELIAEHAPSASLKLTVAAKADELAGEVSQVERIVREGDTLTVYGTGSFAADVMKTLILKDITITSASMTEPTLEEVFLNLTGRKMKEEN